MSQSIRPSRRPNRRARTNVESYHVISRSRAREIDPSVPDLSRYLHVGLRVWRRAILTRIKAKEQQRNNARDYSVTWSASRYYYVIRRFNVGGASHFTSGQLTFWPPPIRERDWGRRGGGREDAASRRAKDDNNRQRLGAGSKVSLASRSKA